MAGLVNGRSLTAFVLAGIAWPLAGLRGLPWLGRSMRAITGGGRSAAALRTVWWSLLGVVVFGLLFASADAIFAEWAAAVVPDLQLDTFVLRAFLTVAVGGVVLAATYLALNHPGSSQGPAGRGPSLTATSGWPRCCSSTESSWSSSPHRPPSSSVGMTTSSAPPA
jgi:hypothetical protein